MAPVVAVGSGVAVEKLLVGNAIDIEVIAVGDECKLTCGSLDVALHSIGDNISVSAIKSARSRDGVLLGCGLEEVPFG